MIETASVDEFYGGSAPSGSARDGYTTYSEPIDSPLGQAITRYLNENSRFRYTYQRAELEITVHSCWSGYSEYTITSRWDEIEIRWGEQHAHFESMPAFFRALSGVTSDG